MSRQSYTWDDLCSHVEEILKPEGSAPERKHLLRLLDQAFNDISLRVDGVVTSWDNSADGGLTLTGSTCPWPVDCLQVFRIEWDGADNPLKRTTVSERDKNSAGWRDASGDPRSWMPDGRNILIDSTPTGSTTGKLVARGRGMIPAFSEESGAENPLDYMPLALQLKLTDYIVWKCPVVPAVTTGDSDAAYRYAQTETQRRVAVREDAKRNWLGEQGMVGGLDEICQFMRERNSEIHYDLEDGD